MVPEVQAKLQSRQGVKKQTGAGWWLGSVCQEARGCCRSCVSSIMEARGIAKSQLRQEKAFRIARGLGVEDQ